MLGAGSRSLELQTEEAGPFGGGTSGWWRRSNGNASRFASNSSGRREEGKPNGKGVCFQTTTHLLQMSRRRAGTVPEPNRNTHTCTVTSTT
ncbi:uncharacterized protein LOC144005056 isoform X5 [Festucalex cinctus]